MNLVKSALCVAVLAGVSFTAAAEVDVYGKANVTVQSVDEGEGTFSEIKSNASRFGLKGSEKLESGLEVIYKVEFQVDLADDEDDNIKARNQYVGLKGGFGEVVIGRNDTALKQSQGKLDLFNDLEGDIKRLFKGENRLGDTVSYKSMDLNGFRVLATYIAKDQEAGKSGLSGAITYGDAELKNSQVYLSLAADSEVKGYDAVRFGAQTKLADFTVGAMYQTQEKVDGSAEADGYLLNATYKMGANTFKAQYQVIDFDAGNKIDGLSVGVDHKLSKNAKVFAFYSTFDADNQAESNYLALGMEYKF
ncbi:porin [Pseudoalteromonas fenneropenaei]|uniref:Porin n=1 Tax=Pseudoalteromonas fenneropenaei TaxID=1737459 RepID=A0ABV7CP68_9GAMM